MGRKNGNMRMGVIPSYHPCCSTRWYGHSVSMLVKEGYYQTLFVLTKTIYKIHTRSTTHRLSDQSVGKLASFFKGYISLSWSSSQLFRIGFYSILLPIRPWLRRCSPNQSCGTSVFWVLINFQNHNEEWEETQENLHKQIQKFVLNYRKIDRNYSRNQESESIEKSKPKGHTDSKMISYEIENWKEEEESKPRCRREGDPWFLRSRWTMREWGKSTRHPRTY